MPKHAASVHTAPERASHSITTHTHAASTGGRDGLRQAAVLVTAILAIIVSFLGSGAVVGTPVAEVAGGALATDSTLVAPAGAAFAIWSIIYTGLLALAVWQVLPTHRTDERQRQVGWLVVGSLVLNAVWVLVVQAGWITASVPVILALLAVLVLTLVTLSRTRPSSRTEAVLVDGSLGLYLGWVCIAVVANTAAALVDLGVDATGDAATAWAVAILVVAGAVGVLLAVGLRGRLAPAIGLAWGLAWVAVARTDAPESTVVAIAAAAAAVVTLGSALVVRLMNRRSRDEETFAHTLT
jgi:hypothetical protein